jgi:hypothetical protein
MPRQARLDAPGTLHHVIIRGIEQKEIVKDDHDRQNFVYRMGTIALETGTLIYVWTLMTNHTHIFLIRFRLYFDMSHLTSSGVPPTPRRIVAICRASRFSEARLNRSPAAVNRTSCSRTACFHDAFIRMRPGMVPFIR